MMTTARVVSLCLVSFTCTALGILLIDQRNVCCQALCVLGCFFVQGRIRNCHRLWCKACRDTIWKEILFVITTGGLKKIVCEQEYNAGNIWHGGSIWYVHVHRYQDGTPCKMTDNSRRERNLQYSYVDTHNDYIACAASIFWRETGIQTTRHHLSLIESLSERVMWPAGDELMNEVVILIPVFEGVNNLRRGYASAHPQFEPQLGNSFCFWTAFWDPFGIKNSRLLGNLAKSGSAGQNWQGSFFFDPILQLTQLINNNNDGHKVKPASKQAPEDHSARRVIWETAREGTPGPPQ